MFSLDYEDLLQNEPEMRSQLSVDDRAKIKGEVTRIGKRYKDAIKMKDKIEWERNKLFLYDSSSNVVDVGRMTDSILRSDMNGLFRQNMFRPVNYKQYNNLWQIAKQQQPEEIRQKELRKYFNESIVELSRSEITTLQQNPDMSMMTHTTVNPSSRQRSSRGRSRSNVTRLENLESMTNPRKKIFYARKIKQINQSGEGMVDKSVKDVDQDSRLIDEPRSVRQERILFL